MKGLELSGIEKVYGNGVVANQNIDISFEQSEIHAIVGENGAGKTTLMKMIFGMEEPTRGKILLAGKEVHFHSPLDAVEMGIGMVHQHFMLVPSFTILENILLGREPSRFGVLQLSRERKNVEELCREYHFDLNLDDKVEDLTVGNKQKVEILKVLYQKANIIILDEPTAVLTPQETEKLFEQLMLLKGLGKTIIFISHKLGEVKQISDRITVLRRGKVISTHVTSEIAAEEISELMIAEQPTRGVDVGSASIIHKHLIRLRNDGRAILMISADLGEALAVCDRVMVLYSGEIAAIIENPREITEKEIGLFNLGAEGIFYFSGIVATAVAVVPMNIGKMQLVLALAAAAAAGGAAASISGFFKAKYDANELVISLMMNTILYGIGFYILKKKLKDPDSVGVVSSPFQSSAKLSKIIPGTRVSSGLIILIAVTVLVWLLLYKTKYGYAMRITGYNKKFAVYSGMNFFAITLLVHVLSGSIAGLGAAVEVLGLSDRFSWSTLPGYGFDGALVAMIGRNHPIGSLFAALLLAYLRTGCVIVARNTDVPSEMVCIVEIALVLLITSDIVLRHYRQKKIMERGMAHE